MTDHPTRSLRAGDFFPDIAGRDCSGQPWHSAEHAGRVLALWLCTDDAAAYHHADVIAHFSATMLPGIATWVLRFGAGVATSDHSVLLVGAEHAQALLLPGDIKDTVLYLLRPDGKIAWCGTPLANRYSNVSIDALRIAVETLAAKAATTGMPPLLSVDRALPAGLCSSLVAMCRDSQARVQGRVGLSAPRLDPTLKRVSHINLDPSMAAVVDECLIYSLLPMVERCFDYRTTRRVAYKVAMYDAADAGYFHAHRDNADRGTRYRRFALSLALNDDWEGDGLAFPEFGPNCHRIGAGNALVFPVSLLHEVHPVQRGQRFVLLSFFYDEAGARDRRACMVDPSVLDTKFPDAIAPRLLSDYDRHFAPVTRFASDFQVEMDLLPGSHP